MSQILLKKLIAGGLAKEKNIKGCSYPEIIKLERKLNMKLPESYKSFLLTMGHSADKFYLGSDFTYEKLEQIQIWSKELLQESPEYPELPEKTFVFMMHQGYQFCFFHLDEGNNPFVFGYLEGNRHFDKFEKFDEFMLISVDAFL